MTRRRHVDMGELRLTVFRRDQWRCLADKLTPGRHQCRNQWGEAVTPGDGIRYRNALTLEHVRLEPGGKRLDREEGCVTLCHGANVEEHWGSAWENRSQLNAYLDERYPGRRALWA